MNIIKIKELKEIPNINDYRIDSERDAYIIEGGDDVYFKDTVLEDLYLSDHGENEADYKKLLKPFIRFVVEKTVIYQKVNNISPDFEDYFDEDDEEYALFAGCLTLVKLRNKEKETSIVIDYECYDCFDPSCSSVNKIYIIEK